MKKLLIHLSLDADSDLLSVQCFQNTEKQEKLGLEMKELVGKHSASRRDDPYSKKTMELADKIEKLKEKIDEDAKEIKDQNCGIAFAVFKRPAVAKLIRENERIWLELESIKAIDGLSSCSISC